MRDDEFEWDDRKAVHNLARHKIDFKDARRAFADPHIFERDDRRIDYTEDRFTVLGMVRDKLFFVAYTYRNERIRIISARGADQHEQRLYHEAKARGSQQD